MVVDWIAPVERGQPAIAALERLSSQGSALLAPPLLIAEVSNALLTGVRRGRWDGAMADGARSLLAEAPVRLEDDSRDVDRAWDLARRFDNHPIYDMVYVALAERTGMKLITSDPKLRRALAGLDLLVSPEEVLR